MFFLPLFSGEAAVSPDDLANYSNITSAGDNNSGQVLQPNDTFVVNDTTIEINEVAAGETEVILNGTYKVHLKQTSNELSADFYKLSGTGTHFEVDDRLLGVDIATYETNTTTTVYIPGTGDISIVNAGPEMWYMEFPDFSFHYDGVINSLTLEASDYVLTMDENWVIIDHAFEMDVALEKTTDRSWKIHAFPTPMNVTYYPTRYYAPNDNLTVTDDFGVIIYSGPVPAAPFQNTNPTGITFSFQDEVLIISYLYWSFSFYPDMIVIHYYDIAIIIYFDNYVIVSRIVIIILDLTFIFYFINIIIDLYLVIIYYDIEIKFYYTQVVIVYESIEIVMVFISISIWEITIIWHIDIWILQIIFIIQINILIVQPVRLIFIPVLIPVFIPIIYYVPVYITNTIHIYIPYAALQVYIDIHSQDLRHPTHSIQYFVYDQTGAPINDATVTVDYNGTVYPTTFLGNGIYEVALPASDEKETITVTATKPWYPTGILTYDLNVTWVTEVVTQSTPMYILPIIISLAFMAVGTTIIRKRKS